MENEIRGIPEVSEPPETELIETGFRLRAFILLLIVVIPIVLAVYELVSAQISAQTLQTVQPHLPQLDKVITF